MQKRDLNYLAALLLGFIFLWMLITGLLQVRFALHRFIYHRYGAYLLIFLAVIHVFANWKKISGFIKRKIRLRKENALSIALVFSLVLTLALGFLQVKLNFPRSGFVYHIYSAYITLTLALIHIFFNLGKVTVYLKSKSRATLLGAGLLVITLILLVVKWPLSKKQPEIEATLEESAPMKFDMATKYHKETKHAYAELMVRTGGLDWAKQPTVFKEYPKREVVKLSTDFDFDSISVEKAIEMGPFEGSFSGKAITKEELSLLLYYTNGVTRTLRYPGLTYYLRAAPSAGALYPTVIYLVVNNVEGLKKGVYHYSVKDHALHFLKEGDFMEELYSWCNGPSSLRKASVVFVMSAIFYRTKWKYRERGYRYTLLDTGHVAGNLTLIARALGLGSYPIGTFVDDKVNQMLDIDGLKEAVVYINAVGKRGTAKGKDMSKQAFTIKKELLQKSREDLSIAELLHERGKIDSFNEKPQGHFTGREVSYKNYPELKKIELLKNFSKNGLSLDNAIRKRRSARDYSNKPIPEPELSRLLYYTYGAIEGDSTKRAAGSIEGLYPIELYAVINNVEGIARGVYHYNILEHALELIKEGDYRFRIANACLGQELVGNANVAIIKTALFERIKDYGDRGYRYIHLDAGAIGENIYLEAVSMGLGVCGIGAFFDDQINEMLGIDGVKESVIYVTSVGRLG